MVKGPGVVIGRKGTLGTVFFLRTDFWPHDTTLWVKDFHGNDPCFAYYFLKTMGFEQYDCGASNPTLNRNHIHCIPIVYPKLTVQRKIARVLSAYDDLIENNTRRIAILEEMAQALYREWFVRFPLKKQRFVTGDLMERGILEIGDGYRAKNSELSDSGLPFIRAKDINNGFLFDDADLLNPSSVSKAGNKLSQPKDIVLTSKGTVGRFAFVTRHTPQFVYAPQLCYWRSLDHARVQPLFLLHWMQTNDFLDQVGKVKGLTDMADYVSLSDQRKMVIELPSREDQGWLIDHLEPIQSLIENNRRRIASMRATRDLLLPKLISGELNVEHLNIDLGELESETFKLIG